jgi:hypothetical protein
MAAVSAVFSTAKLCVFDGKKVSITASNVGCVLVSVAMLSAGVACVAVLLGA